MRSCQANKRPALALRESISYPRFITPSPAARFPFPENKKPATRDLYRSLVAGCTTGSLPPRVPTYETEFSASTSWPVFVPYQRLPRNTGRVKICWSRCNVFYHCPNEEKPVCNPFVTCPMSTRSIIREGAHNPRRVHTQPLLCSQSTWSRRYPS